MYQHVVFWEWGIDPTNLGHRAEPGHVLLCQSLQARFDLVHHQFLRFQVLRLGRSATKTWFILGEKEHVNSLYTYICIWAIEYMGMYIHTWGFDLNQTKGSPRTTCHVHPEFSVHVMGYVSIKHDLTDIYHRTEHCTCTTFNFAVDEP